MGGAEGSEKKRIDRSKRKIGGNKTWVETGPDVWPRLRRIERNIKTRITDSGIRPLV